MSKIQRVARQQARSRGPGVPAVPARLCVSLAAKSPRALVLRTGPGKWTQAILWHTDSDTFEYGQWFHGTVHSANLSPDGSKFVYHAVKYHLEWLVKSGKKHDLLYRWVAVSKPPYFTALALWEVGEYVGALGCFVDDQHTILSGVPQNKLRTPTVGRIPASLVVTSDHWQEIWLKNEKLGGWQIEEKRVIKRDPRLYASDLVDPLLWRKQGRRGDYNLFRRPGRTWGTQIFYLARDDNTEQIPLDNVQWADFDKSGRLVFAYEGGLWAGEVLADKIESTLLVDLTPQHVTEVIAPDSARRW